MNKIKANINTAKVVNVIKLDSSSDNAYTLQGGMRFCLFLNPKANSGINLGNVVVAKAILAYGSEAVEVPFVVGEWTPLVFQTVHVGSFTDYTYGSAVAVGTLYKNGGKLYKGEKTVAAYDANAQYAVGDYAINSSTVYKCATAITTPEPFDSTKWTAVATVSAMVTEGILSTVIESIDLTEVDVYVAALEDLQ